MFSKLKPSILSTIFVFSIIAICAGNLTAQISAVNAKNFVGSKLNATVSTQQINDRMKTVFGASALPQATKSVDLYKVSYSSLNEKGSSVVLSGLVALPKNEAPKGLVVFAHGTFADRNLSPSRYTGKATASETELAILAFTSGGYGVAMPDYLGLGDDKGFHPYPVALTNSVSTIDIIQPARTVAARQNVALGSRLFITGYSEGGAVAMWAVRELEKKTGAEYKVTAAAPLSGPYDLSGTTRKWILSPAANQTEFGVRLYLLSYMAYAFHKNKGLKLTDYFKPAMALTISQAYKTNRTDEDIIKRLVVAATLMRAKNSVENVITDRFKRALESLDRSDPVIKELERNDTFDWSPRTKMLLVNLENDFVVDPGNTDITYRTMRKRGVNQRLISQYVIRDKNLNHITGVPTALVEARKFFDKESGN
ncbi:MAG: lipase family protein [Pyrinomonadaceae bacterium]